MAQDPASSGLEDVDLAFLTDAERGGLRVTRMIIHVVGHPDDPFAPEDEVDVQQEGFFRARIMAEAGEGVHQFADGSPVKITLERIAREEITFEQGGRDLARRFREFHVRQSVKGAFFLLELRSELDGQVLYALVKYDYREAVELAQAGGRNVLRAIVQALVQERRAVQKICIARVVDGTAEQVVSASDRMRTAPDLTDYFERYLDVFRSRSNAELSDRLNEALRGSVEELRPNLPRRDVGGAIARAKTALQGRATVTNDDVVDAVLHAADRPVEEDLIVQIERTTRRWLKKSKLQDVEFRPDQDTLSVQPRRVVRTVEQVRLEYPAEELGNSVNREDTQDEVIFTIRTARLLQDGTLADRPR